MEEWTLTTALISISALKETFPSITSIGEPIRGGQKTVYPVVIGGKDYALKVLVTRADEEGGNTALDSLPPNEHFPRVLREVEILDSCNIPQLVRLGPIKLASHNIQGQHVLCYTEEWVKGDDLRSLISSKKLLSQKETVRLGLDITESIRTLWSLHMVHRDIKPANIMKRCDGGGFVLLDPGIALDVDGTTLTLPGHFPGTFSYVSPEQMMALDRRTMDFRSDFFNLGIVMYEAVTGVHPFLADNRDRETTLRNILDASPRPLSDYKDDVSEDLSRIILRLMSKKPHRRYRSCDLLREDIRSLSLEENT